MSLENNTKTDSATEFLRLTKVHIWKITRETRPTMVFDLKALPHIFLIISFF